jgi:NADH-quinone oxidoreductase subunit J
MLFALNILVLDDERILKMDSLFYIIATILLFTAWKAVQVSNAVHALLYLIASLLSTATIFFMIGAPYVGILEIIVYAGAIMVLFIFVIMLLNIGPQEQELKEKISFQKTWPVCFLLSTIGILLFILIQRSGIHQSVSSTYKTVGPKEVGMELFTKYAILVELASFVLLAGLIIAYYIGKRLDKKIAFNSKH